MEAQETQGIEAMDAASGQVTMAPRGPWTVGNRLVGFDPQRVRVWVGGQRLHHGATGICLAGAAVAKLAVRRRSARPLAWVLGGAALVAHDWKDRSVWFARGPQAEVVVTKRPATR